MARGLTLVKPSDIVSPSVHYQRRQAGTSSTGQDASFPAAVQIVRPLSRKSRPRCLITPLRGDLLGRGRCSRVSPSPLLGFRTRPASVRSPGETSMECARYVLV